MSKDYFFTKEEVKELQSRNYYDKKETSLAKAQEIISKTDGKIYVAYSGGKDSGVILDITCVAWKLSKHKDKPLLVALANTTLEFKGLLSHAKKFIKHMEEKHGVKIKLHVTMPDVKPAWVFENIGYPIASKSTAMKVGRIRKIMKEKRISYSDIKDHLECTIENAEYLRKLGFNSCTVSYLCGIKKDNTKASHSTKLARRWIPLLYADFETSEECCEFIKKGPQKKMDKVMKVSPVVGEMASESQQRETSYMKTGCVSSIGKGKFKGKIIGFWLEEDVLRYTKEYDLPLFEYYKEIKETDDGLCLTGIKRSGCKCCLMGCQYADNSIHQLKYLEPKAWENILKPIEEKGFGYRKVIEFLNEHCKCNIEI